MQMTPLRYNISSWRQLPQCLSNTSRKLSLKITDFFNQANFAGFRISVVHELYGVLFSCCLNTSGPVVDSSVPDMSTSAILEQLAKFGFNVSYNPRQHLSGEQISYLMTLNGLDFDKLRIISVSSYLFGEQKITNYIVAFNVAALPDWVDITYSPSDKEFSAALKAGSVVNLTAVTKEKNFVWDWLNYVASIEDILLDQTYDE